MPFDADAVRRWLDDIHHHIILAEQFAEVGIAFATLPFTHSL
jgi:hypothetical protein